MYSRKFKDTYHSTYGAVTESRHVFMRNGLQFSAESTNDIVLLELGFGTGLNTILAIDFARLNPGIKLKYVTYELYPLSQKDLRKLDYPSVCPKSLLMKLHELSWGEEHDILNNFSLTKWKKNFSQLRDKGCYNLLFHDAFAPKRQPEYWDRPFLDRLALCMSTQGVLVTYCSQGRFRRALREVGFQIESLPGPPGKREMTRGIKIE